jgi:hypothetical protein
MYQVMLYGVHAQNYNDNNARGGTTVCGVFLVYIFIFRHPLGSIDDMFKKCFVWLDRCTIY